MTSLNTAVPHHLSHLLDRPHDHARTIHLSRHAAHASRVHAVVESLSGDALRVVVVGQNGLRLVCEGRSRRLVQGQRADVCREVGYVELDFYGSRVRVAFQGEEEAEEKEEEEEGRERLFTPPPPSAREGMLSPVSPVSSMPPSSPPLALEALDEEARSRGSSPLSAASEDEHEPEDEDEVPHDPETQNATAINDLAEKEPDAKEIKAEHLDTLPRSSTPPTAKPNTLPPESIDLTALLASTVVFSGSSKLSLPDLVKHMLEVCRHPSPLSCTTTDYSLPLSSFSSCFVPCVPVTVPAEFAETRRRIPMDRMGGHGARGEPHLWHRQTPRQSEYRHPHPVLPQ